MLATPEQAQWFVELDTLLKEIAGLEITKNLLKHGGGILIHQRGGGVVVHYDGGLFEMCQRRIEKDKKTSGK
ncbi:MAG: hypothetical protein ABFD52_00665 [Acidobacteriota bacterium]